MMKISFKRTGADHETDIQLGVDLLPAGQSRKFLRMIEAADFFKLPEDLGTAAMLDEPQYFITIDAGEGRRHTVRVNDGAVPESMRPLIVELSRLADSRPG